MLNVRNDTLRQRLRQVGQIFGYRYQVNDEIYMTTVKTRVNRRKSTRQQSKFIEDMYSS